MFHLENHNLKAHNGYREYFRDYLFQKLKLH